MCKCSCNFKETVYRNENKIMHKRIMQIIATLLLSGIVSKNQTHEQMTNG
jgi:hypothetical protein